MEYLISVIVPIYKVELYIERCLNSLFNQTIADKCEFILINDASPDKSLQIAKDCVSKHPELKSNIKIIDKKENEGLSAARKSGILAANGKYIIHIDSDDWCELDMFEKLFKNAEANNADITNCNMIFEYSDKSVVVKQNPGSTNEEAVGKLLNGFYGAFITIKLVKRTLYSNFNILPDEKIGMWEDLNLALPLYFFAKKISYVDEAFYHYERSNVSSMCNNMNEKYVEQLFSVVDSKIKFLTDKNEVEKYQKEIKNLKIRAKCFVFVQVNSKVRKNYINKYKEINSCIMDGVGIPKHNKLITYFYCNKMSLFGNVCLGLLKFLKRVLKK